MRPRPLLLLMLLLAAAPATFAAESHQVRLLIRDGAKPAVNVAVVVRYPDGERTDGSGYTLTTDDAGAVEFVLPADNFWLTVRELNPDFIGKEFFVAAGHKSVVMEVHPREWRREERRP
jgi:uncharacterized GH25 family protein